MATIAVVMVTSALGTWLVRRWAARHLLDVPNHRSSHRDPTPRGGGVGLLAGVVAGWGGLAAPDAQVLVWPLLGLFMLALADDLWTVPARFRLMGQIAVAVAAVVLIGGFAEVSVPPLGTVSGWGLVAVLSGLWLVGLTNVYNFLDGIDGMATVQGIVAGAAWWVIGQPLASSTVSDVGLVVAVACLGFLPFNWQPASIFLGDVGSVTLGGIFALLPIMASRSGMEVAAPVGVLVVWPFLFDGVFTVIRRARRKEPLFEAHRSHLYQRLVIAGWSHAEVTTLYALLAIVSAAAAVQVAAGAWAWGWGAAVFVGIAQWCITIRAEQRAGQRSPVSVS
jgi:UDP-N-acetylmuramyl pentapeptide phosphotransferase/UDP-N-acetylglucosamine-1-phosphate transferase